MRLHRFAFAAVLFLASPALALDAGDRTFGPGRGLLTEFISALQAGKRYVRYAPVVRHILVRSALFLVSASALLALLPVVASQRLWSRWCWCRTPPSIPQVIQGGGEPAGHDAEHGDQGEGSQHPHAKEEQGMEARTSTYSVSSPFVGTPLCRTCGSSLVLNPHAVVRSGTLASRPGSALAPVVAAVSTSMSTLSMA